MSHARKLSLVLVVAASVAASLSAFAEDMPARVRGTLQKMDGNNLTIAMKSGKEANVLLKDGAPVIAVTKGAMSDIKSNTFVGITAMPLPDGTQKAVEVHVFEESLRGTGEGHYPWDLMPNSTKLLSPVLRRGECSWCHWLAFFRYISFLLNWSAKYSACRMASATMVSVGFSAPPLVNWLPSEMNRFGMSWVWPYLLHTPSRGFSL